MNKPVKNLIKGARRVGTPNMLSAEEEQALISAWQKNKNWKAREQLLEAFAPLAISVSKRLNPKNNKSDPDLLQQAQIGLMKAADRFDPSRGFRFATYAVWWIRHEVQEFALTNVSVVQGPKSAQARAAAKKIAAIDADMISDQNKGWEYTDKELANALGVDLKRAMDLRKHVARSDRSLNAPASEENGADRLALLVDPSTLGEPIALENMTMKELRSTLSAELNALPNREREIIVATQLYDPPATLVELGVRFGISKERVRQLRERGLERLRVAFEQRQLKFESFF